MPVPVCFLYNVTIFIWWGVGYDGGMDRASIYRRALQCLGDLEYVVGAPTQKACDVAYKGVLQEACARYNWSFTRMYAQVKGEAGVVPGRRLFKLPGDCVKVVEMVRADGRGVCDPEMCAAGLLLPLEDGEVVTLIYHCDLLGDLAVLDEGRTALFVEGVVRLLASKVAMALTSSEQLAMALKQESDDYFYRAILMDKQQDWSNAKEPRTLLRKRMYNR